jgi:hypothetical protein
MEKLNQIGKVESWINKFQHSDCPCPRDVPLPKNTNSNAETGEKLP